MMSLKQFLNYFKSHKADSAEYIPVIWEDDYCKVELIPGANLSFVLRQIKEANLFAEEHRTELGYTAVFMRKDNPMKTISEEIRADYLRKAIISFRLPELTKMRYQGGSLEYFSGSNTSAFGFPWFTLFFDTEGEFVKNIWVKFAQITSGNDVDIIISSLYNLGEENDLILVDWNSDDIIDLKNKNQIRNYLAEWRG